jgi:hypothetical protein
VPETPLDTFLETNVIKRAAEFEEGQESVKEHRKGKEETAKKLPGCK